MSANSRWTLLTVLPVVIWACGFSIVVIYVPGTTLCS